MSPSNPHTFTLRNTTFTAPPLEAGLYLVSTPIGNLGDITIRGLETLAASDVIACEDTRTSGVLLKRYGIEQSKISYTEHNASQRGPELLNRISNGEAVALISDAGTPLVSDPGFRLVEEAAKLGLPVVPVPGANAPLSALVGSGLPTLDFRFIGFLPSKAKARLTQLTSLARESATLIFFESPSRIAATLSAAMTAFGEDRRACIARELTKMHETFHRGTLKELSDEFSNMDRVRGEIVWMVEGATANVPDGKAIDDMLKEALTTMKPGAAASWVSEQTGISRQDIYQRVLAMKDGG